MARKLESELRLVGGIKGARTSTVLPTNVVPMRDETNHVKDILSRLVFDDNEPMMLVSSDGEQLYANSEYLRIVKRSGDDPAHVIGAKMDTAFCGEELVNALGQVMVSKRQVRFRATGMFDKQERLFVGRMIPIFADDAGLECCAVLLRDATSTVRHALMASSADEQFRDFARATSDWFWETDKSLKILTVSDRLGTITGLNAEALKGQRLDELGEFANNYEGENTGYQAIAKRVPFRDQLLVIEGSEGTLKFHISGVPIFDKATGEFTGYRGAALDQTRLYTHADEVTAVRDDLQSRLEDLTLEHDTLRAAYRTAIAELEVKDQLLMSLRNDLEEPIDTVLACAAVMDQQTLGRMPRKYREYASTIHTAGKALRLIFDGLRSLSGTSPVVQGLMVEASRPR